MAKPDYTDILTQTSPPDPIVSLADAKEHLRVDHTDDDTLITTLCNAVTQLIDGETGLIGYSVSTQKWLLKTHNAWDYNAFGQVIISLPKTPVKEIMSIKWYNASNTLITETLSDWTLVANHDWAYITPNDGLIREEYYRPDSFQVEIQCGLQTIPETLIQAAKLALSVFYDNRGESGVELPQAFYTLVNLSRRGWVG